MENAIKTTELSFVFGTPCILESSLCESSAQKSKQQMSFSLKQRLKRSRRSFTSPASVVKRLKIGEDDDQQSSRATPERGTETVTQMNIENRNDILHTENRRAEVPGSISETAQPTDELELRDQLKKEVKERTETLRRLKMVKMYRSKNDLTQLRVLIDKWRRCSQAALYDLQSDLPVDGKKTSMSQLIDLFGLEDSILHFDRTEEDFTSA
ncbi:hypothetical protein DPEC_G00035560 [Dallia pectoralis]|uniref:Uncharacterized protein n=1 Tax=Dallia pectoralis TaxID=75939 RepID=A0ACC2HES3_DALPE|nr:hypothetical protein DPEC_G00035560 [Dallia pectoralis]